MASITKINNTTFQIVVSNGYKTNGQKIRKKKTFRLDTNLTEKQKTKEIQRLAYEFEKQVLNGDYLKGDIKFKDFAQIFMKDHAEKNLSPTTVKRYYTLLDRINLGIGHLSLNEIKPYHLMKFYNSLEEKGSSKKPIKDNNGNIIGYKDLSPKTILHHQKLVSAILRKSCFLASNKRKCFRKS